MSMKLIDYKTIFYRKVVFRFSQMDIEKLKTQTLNDYDLYKDRMRQVYGFVSDLIKKQPLAYEFECDDAVNNEHDRIQPPALEKYVPFKSMKKSLITYFDLFQDEKMIKIHPDGSLNLFFSRPLQPGLYLFNTGLAFKVPSEHAILFTCTNDAKVAIINNTVVDDKDTGLQFILLKVRVSVGCIKLKLIILQLIKKALRPSAKGKGVVTNLISDEDFPNYISFSETLLFPPRKRESSQGRLLQCGLIANNEIRLQIKKSHLYNCAAVQFYCDDTRAHFKPLRIEKESHRNAFPSNKNQINGFLAIFNAYNIVRKNVIQESKLTKHFKFCSQLLDSYAKIFSFTPNIKHNFMMICRTFNIAILLYRTNSGEIAAKQREHTPFLKHILTEKLIQKEDIEKLAIETNIKATNLTIFFSDKHDDDNNNDDDEKRTCLIGRRKEPTTTTTTVMPLFVIDDSPTTTTTTITSVKRSNDVKYDEPPLITTITPTKMIDNDENNQQIINIENVESKNSPFNEEINGVIKQDEKRYKYDIQC